MRLPLGTGTIYHVAKWMMLAFVFGIFAANIVVPVGALLFLFLPSEGLAGFLSFLVWLASTGVLLWLVARHGRKERRLGRERPHTSMAVDRALPPQQLQNDYDLLDVGLKPWRTGSRVFRDEALPDDLPAFYPTVKLWMKRSYVGRLFFEFFDENGDTIPRYTRSKRVLLLTGFRNITMRDEVVMDTPELPEGVWGMHVRLDDRLLAVHRFSWFPVGVLEEPEEDFVYPHAQVAVQVAGATINDIRPTLTDVGLLVARNGTEDINIFRTEPVPHDTVAVQPFVRFNLPERAAGNIRFVLHDAAGETHFDYREEHEYDPGDNLIAARARMPVDDWLALGTGWQLDVHVGQTLVACHRFDWQRSIPPILDPLEEDGEISSRLRQRLADQDEDMSLRDLLSEQRRRHKR